MYSKVWSVRNRRLGFARLDFSSALRNRAFARLDFLSDVRNRAKICSPPLERTCAAALRRARGSRDARVMGDIEELIDASLLTGQHPKLSERCSAYSIVSVFEDTFGKKSRFLVSSPGKISRLRPPLRWRCGPPALISYLA